MITRGVKARQLFHLLTDGAQPLKRGRVQRMARRLLSNPNPSELRKGRSVAITTIPLVRQNVRRASEDSLLSGVQKGHEVLRRN